MIRPLLAALLLLPLAAQAPAQAPAPAAPDAPRGAGALPDAATMQREYAARRAALAERLGDGVIVALGAPEPAHDYEYFFQRPDFVYLTGWREPDAALVLVKRGASLEGTLLVVPRDPAREVWSGVRAGPQAAAERTGLRGRARGELDGMVDSLARAGLPLHVVGDLSARRQVGQPLTADDQWIEALRERHPSLKVASPAQASQALQAMRGTKSAAELAYLRRAIDITVRAHAEALGALEPGMNEFELQALIEYTFRRNGADRPGFASIVGSGPNATTLHYNANDRPIRAGDLVVMDIGASYGGYSADVTRTLPATGRFTAEQRAVYQLVRDAQAAAERQAVPGAQASRMMDSARATIARGLARIGLTEGADATYDCGVGANPPRCPQVALYFMHGLGHGIGLEVHDPDQYYFTGTIAAGSAFTIEPGVYVRANLLDIIPDTPRNRQLKARIGDAVRRHANVGVRIEDDYLVTERGTEWVSRAPREADEIERLMQQPWAGPASRDPALVGGYRKDP